MPRKRKLSDLSERCRFCLARQEAACSTELFADWIQPKLQDLERCVDLEILDKPLYPKKICYVCLYKLEMWCDLKSQFLKTQKTILTHFKVIDQQANDEEKVANVENTTDDLLSDNDKKRQKIEDIISEPQPSTNVAIKPALVKPPVADSTLSSDVTNTEEKNKNNASKTQPSDNSVTSGRKSIRTKKIEREASTKRWVERKSALIAATGEISSDSESDNPAQLSPVQKARAKSNNEQETDMQKKKIQKALKNLETNMTEKYKVSQDFINDERKTRSRRTNFVEEQKVKEVTKVLLSKPAEAEKKVTQESLKKDLREKQKEKGKEIETEKMKRIEGMDYQTLSDMDGQPMIVPEAERHPQEIKDSDDVEIIEMENAAINAEVLSPKKNTSVMMPQLVTSEVSVGNATYIVTTTLDVPESSPSTKSDISVKTNGINVDSASQDGKKIDLLNAVELQRVKPQGDKSPSKQGTGGTGTDVQKCLKIEIEGMEVEALQRVQLELANFVKEDIRKRIVEEPSATLQTETKPAKFKDSYESLDHQLKTIIEKVLRSNYEAEKLNSSMLSNHQKISHEFIKAAMNSPVFQPKVAVTRLNVGQLCKLYRINNLHILEEAKRRKGLVGPLSRTLTRRKHRLPKKFDDFSLAPKDEERKESFSEKRPSNRKPFWAKVPDLMPKNSLLDASTRPDVPDIQDVTVPLVDTPVKITPVVNEKPISPKLVNKSSKMTIMKTPVSMKSPTNQRTSLTLKSSSSMSISTTTMNKPPSTPTKVTNTKSTKSVTVNNTPKTQKRQRHICGICGKELFSKEEAEAHVKNHKVEAIGQNPPSNPSSLSNTSMNAQKSKAKLMRCKRCQAIVEARHVKSHVCNSVKYNCMLCDCSFGAEYLLIAHLETHTQSKLKDKRKDITETNEKPSDSKLLEVEPEEEDLERILGDKEPQGYSCFVCDKIFVDEEQMKDHLQMHCEEVSEEGNEKGFQCAFCFEKFQTEESLETHVGNHLLEDGDQKIKLMIDMETKRKRATFRCEQCNETFSSSLLLAMHLPLHEEEEEAAMLAEYEKQEVEQEHHVCTICDEIFETADELSEHIDIHNGNAHVCILCEKPFSSIRDLQEHVSTHL